MAVGDLIGDLATAYLTPAQRAAQALKNAGGTGVVGRAQQQLPPVSLASLGTAAATTQAANQPVSLASLSPGGTAAVQQPAPAPLNLASAGQRQTSFNQTNLPPQYANPQSLSSLAPTGVLPTATSQQYPAPAQQRANDLRSMGPGDTPLAAPTASLDQAYRPTGVGQGASAIAGRISADGTAEFSNAPADLASAAGLARLNTTPQQASGAPVSLADLMPGSGAAPSMNADLASLGSARNLGDGIGTFSQAAPGDAALSLARFGRANDIRRAGRDQDRADLANARLAQADQLTVVGDSSQPVTRRDVLNAQNDQQKRQNLADAATGAQGVIDTRRQGQAADQQQRQAQRLEDLAVAATGPNATAETQNRLFAATDPKGYAQNQREAPLKALELQNKQLDNTRLQQQIDTANSTQQQSAQEKARTQAGQVATIDQALNSVDSLLGTKVDPKNPAGARTDEDPGLASAVGLSSILPTRPGSDAANFEARLDTLKAQSFLPQVALLKGAGALSDAEGKKLSDSIGALSPKMSEDAFRKSLSEIRTTFAASRERIGGATPAATTQQPVTTQPRSSASAPAVGTVQQGYVFLGGDPASQASWRAQ